MSTSVPGNQIGFLNSDGTVNAMSSPAANANNLLVQTVDAQLDGGQRHSLGLCNHFRTQGLGAPAARDAVTAFTQIT